MKTLFVTVLALGLSATSFAQETGYSSAQAQQKISNQNKGIKAGIVYSNITDSKIKNTYDSGYGYMIERTSSGGTQLGVMGLNVGYKDNYAFGSIGYEASATVMKSINKSEAEEQVTIYKVQGGLVVPFTDNFSAVGGLNLSYFPAFDTKETNTTPALGLDAGIQGNMNGVGVMLGAQVLGLNVQDEDSSGKAEGYVSGFITSVSYTF